MNFIKRHIARFVAVATLVIFSVVADAAPSWSKVASVSPEAIENVNADRIDVRVVDGNIILMLGNPAPVKIFTILGQLVAQQNLEAGVWSLPITARGIYILKIGSVTRRITI